MVEWDPLSRHSLISCGVMEALATSAVVLRFTSIYFGEKKWCLDDLLVLSGLVVYWGFGAIEIWGVYTIRDHLGATSSILKALYALNGIYGTVVTFIRLSILWFLRRIFETRQFSRMTLVAGALCLAWWLVYTVVGFVPCMPPSRFWQQRGSEHCYNFDVFYLGVGIVDILLDFLILALPLKTVLTLQTSGTRRTGFVGIFALGGFACITNIVRVQQSYAPHSRNIRFTAALWANIHLSTAIICACLPFFRPIATGMLSATSNLRHHLGLVIANSKRWRSRNKDSAHDMTSLRKQDPEDVQNVGGDTRHARPTAQGTVNIQTRGRHIFEGELAPQHTAVDAV